MNINNIGLTALAGALVSVSANAADLSVTGGASIGFSGEEEQTTGNGWTMNDGITFAASAEMDNGWTVSTSMLIDSSDGGANDIIDNRSLTIDMGDTGSLTFNGDGGSSSVALMVDTTPTAGEQAWDDVTGATVHSYAVASGNSDWFAYTNTSLMDGLTLKLDYVPSDGTTDIESSTAGTIKYTGIEGLTIGAGMGEDNGEGAAASIDVTVLNATYAMDAFTIGWSSSEEDSNAADSDVTLVAMGASYAVNDDVSVSINTATHEIEGGTDQDSFGISASMVMGSMTLSANHNSVENIAGISGTDRTGYGLGLSFAF
jgi:outer membrane protein OmpU